MDSPLKCIYMLISRTKIPHMYPALSKWDTMGDDRALADYSYAQILLNIEDHQ